MPIRPRPHRLQFICALLLVALGIVPIAARCAIAGESPVQLVLAHEGHAQLPIVVGDRASPETKSLAAQLGEYLKRISGATFTVEAGDASRGIALGMPGDFNKPPVDVKFGSDPFQRETYVMRTHADGLYLLGASDLAVSHAVWDLLHRLGYRQYFPSEDWEIIPQARDLKISINEQQQPAFVSRRIWYDWGLLDYNQAPYQQWCTRNRVTQGFVLNSGHSYEAIIAANRAEFDKHPEYLALLDGKRQMRGDVKLCIGNPNLRKLVVDYAVRTMQANPKLDSISMDPSDGGGWCECDDCKKLGSISNRVVLLANEVAQAINQLGLGAKYVGIYAYNLHSAPPTIRVDPHVIPSATTAFITGGYTFDKVVSGWQKQGATMGTYDYLSVVDWDWNLPRGPKAARPAPLAQFLVDIHGKGVRFYDAESGDCWGPAGLGYYVAGRVLWDLEEAKRVGAITDEFLQNCFGADGAGAKEPMREFYRLLTQDTQRRSPSDLLARLYRQLAAAHQAAHDPATLKRIDDLTLYTRYAELYYAKAAGHGSVEDVARHAWRMRKTMLVHTYALWAVLVSQQAALTPGHPLKSDAPFTPEELAKFIADGIKNYTPVEPGFVGVEFTRNLVPAGAALHLPAVPRGEFPQMAQDFQRFYVWLDRPNSPLDLTVQVQKVWALRQPGITLYSPLEVRNQPVATSADYKPDNHPTPIRLQSPYAGLHRIETVDGGDYTRMTFPSHLPVAVESGIDTTGVDSQFRGEWTLYFYVPRGTKTVGGWAARVANWAPRISGALVDPDGQTRLDFAKTDDGWFNVPVPAGQDGKLWKFQNSQGMRQLMTVPPYLSRSNEELLLPEEVVKADAQPAGH